MTTGTTGDARNGRIAEENPDVSIVIRVRNEEEWLPHTLKSVFNQRFDGTFEVIVVDNESTDRSLEIAKSFPTRIVHLPKDEFTVGRATNTGCAAARGRFIVMVSGDAIPLGRYWLQTMIDYCDQPGVAGVSGSQNAACLSVGNPAWEPLTAGSRELDFLLKTKGWHFDQVTSAFKRSVWIDYPFNEDPRTFADDMEWAHRVADAGFKVIIGVPASVYHMKHQQEPFSRRLIRAEKVRFNIVLLGHPPFGLRDVAGSVVGPLLKNCHPRRILRTIQKASVNYRASRAALAALRARLNEPGAQDKD